MTAPTIFILLFVVVPLALMLVYSFWTVQGSNIVPVWTLQNYIDFFQKPLFYNQAIKSIRVAMIVTITCLALGFPFAYIVATQPPNRRSTLLLLTTLPMWSSYVVRIFAWRTILGLDGVLNSFLMGTHLIQEPIRAISFSQLAVAITLTNYLLPFMIMPLVTAIEKIPVSQMEAARDLGSNFFSALARVLIPLSLPGVFVGCMNVFIVSLADYLTPKLVGGTEGLMIGNVIQSEFGPAYNWPLGAAATYVSAAIALSLILLLRWFTHRKAEEVKF
jgi:spermidine/putrescine transport system permease protein